LPSSELWRIPILPLLPSVSSPPLPLFINRTGRTDESGKVQLVKDAWTGSCDDIKVMLPDQGESKYIGCVSGPKTLHVDFAQGRGEWSRGP